MFIIFQINIFIYLSYITYIYHFSGSFYRISKATIEWIERCEMTRKILKFYSRHLSIRKIKTAIEKKNTIMKNQKDYCVEIAQ